MKQEEYASRANSPHLYSSTSQSAMSCVVSALKHPPL